MDALSSIPINIPTTNQLKTNTDVAPFPEDIHDSEYTDVVLQKETTEVDVDSIGPNGLNHPVVDEFSVTLETSDDELAGVANEDKKEPNES